MQGISQPFSILFSVTPALSAIGLSSTSISGVGSIPVGTVVGAISVTTNPAGGDTSNVTLSLNAGSKFALSSPTLPSNLITAVAITVSEADPVTINATTP